MGYQNSTFPLAVYGCMDTASRKLLWLRVWGSNSNPKIIGRWYLEYLYETRTISSMLRLDRGTETCTMATIHAFLRGNNGDMDDASDAILYGPSTSNQVGGWLVVLIQAKLKQYKLQPHTQSLISSVHACCGDWEETKPLVQCCTKCWKVSKLIPGCLDKSPYFVIWQLCTYLFETKEGVGKEKKGDDDMVYFHILNSAPCCSCACVQSENSLAGLQYPPSIINLDRCTIRTSKIFISKHSYSYVYHCLWGNLINFFMVIILRLKDAGGNYMKEWRSILRNSWTG